MIHFVDDVKFAYRWLSTWLIAASGTLIVAYENFPQLNFRIEIQILHIVFFQRGPDAHSPCECAALFGDRRQACFLHPQLHGKLITELVLKLFLLGCFLISLHQKKSRGSGW